MPPSPHDDPTGAPTAPQPADADEPTLAPAEATPHPAYDPAATIDQPATTQTAGQHSPPTVPGYEILSVLGRGGMGVVYQARQTALRRIVALKMVLTGGHASQDDRERFRNESLAVAKLQHPNIVQLYEVGEHDGLPYCALELCPGGSLAGRLKGASLPPTEAAAVVETLARAMHFAHANGVVHRDLKPANVLLSPVDSDNAERDSVTLSLAGGDVGGWVLKITDFGLAKRLDASQAYTGSGVVMGTPGYMAPEQADGRTKEAGPSADVYALGAILYDLLTGRPPFKADTSLDTIMQVLRDEPVPPSRVRPGVPKALETVCLKCLEKSPARRYPTALALADDLRQFRTGQRVAARPPGPLVRAAKWARRHPTGAVVLGLLLVVAVAGAAGLYQFVTRLRFERDRAEESARETRRVLYAAQMNLVQSAWKDRHTDTVKKLLDEQRPRPGHEDLRSFEWHYWWGRCHADLLTISADAAMVHQAVFSPDGTRIASAGRDGTVRVWDARTGAELLKVLADQADVMTVAYSPDGACLASAGHDKVVRLWDARTGGLLRTFRGHTNTIFRVVFSPDGTRIATTALEDSVRVWDAESGRELLSVRGKTHRCLAFSPDGTRLAGGGDDALVRVWDARTGLEVLSFQGHKGGVFEVTFSSDGGRIATGGEDQTARVWDADTGKEIRTLRGHAGWVGSVSYGRYDTRLVTSGQDGTLRVWNTATGEEEVHLRGHDGSCRAAFGPGGARLVSAGFNGTVRVWDAQADHNFMRLAMGPVLYVAFGPDGLLAGAGGNVVWIWDARIGWHRAPIQHDGVSSVAITMDGALLASTGDDNVVRIRDARTGHELRAIAGPGGTRVWGDTFSPDGRRIAGACQDNTIRIWDVNTGAVLLTITDQSWGRGLAFSPDGTRLACGVGQTIRVWNSDTGAEVLSIKGHEKSVDALAFSPDGERLASGGTDRAVRVWDARSGSLLQTLLGHGEGVNTVAISPDGRRLASAGADAVRVWDLSTGREVLKLEQGFGALAFSPEGDRLAVAGGGGMWLCDGRPLDDTVRAERAALNRLEQLLDERVMIADIRQQLPHDPFLSDLARQTALDLLPHFRDGPAACNDAAWKVVKIAGKQEADYRRGLEWAESACQLDPDNYHYFNTLGIAQYRTDQYEKAIATFARGQQLRAKASEGELPSDITFQAMARHKLGQTALARELLAEARKLMQKNEWAKDEEEQAFFREAEALIGGSPTPQ